MKNFSLKIGKFTTFTMLLLCMATFSFGQYNFNVSELLDKIILNPEYQQESEVIKQMRLANVSDVKILDHIEENYAKPRKAAAMKKANAGDPIPQTAKKNDMYLLAGCSGGDVGVETGAFTAWTGQTSCRYTSCTGCTSLAWANTALPLANRITLVSGPAGDPCGNVAGFPIPLPSPTGGAFSVKLGNTAVNAETERITHQFIVQPSDTNFIYQYAVVFQDPGHSPSDQPFFDFMIVAQNGDTVPCSYQHYTAGGAIPGFQNSTTAGGCTGAPKYKPWTTVGVNLGKYVGQLVTVICTTGDCGLCGHYGYAYCDFSCGTTAATQFCSGTNSVTVVAPLEPGATYSWTTPAGATTQSVTVNPTVTDTVSVFVLPPGGCGYYVNYILEPTVIKPGFTYTVGCNTANFTDTTLITGGTISNWVWSFPGGTPSSSTSQIPPTVTYPPGGGTHNVSLNIISQAGCTTAVTNYPITLQPPPIVNAGADATVCGGNAVTLNGTATPGGGTYAWSPATGLSSTTAPNPVTGPVLTPIAYTLTYTDTNGCVATDVVNLGIGQEPLALNNYDLELTCEGVTALFTDSSQNAIAWFWDFGDGATSTLQNPPIHQYAFNGTYNVIFIVANGACKDTLITPISVGDINSFITVTAPNVFTPNGDGLNDCFKPIIGGPAVAELEKCMTMEIFDRWGIKVFESTGGVGVCWDGKTKSNIKAKDGTYYYLLEMGGNKFKGYLTLVRDKK